jgi:hypothetical protein
MKIKICFSTIAVLIFLVPFFTLVAQHRDAKTLLYNTSPVLAVVNDSAEVVKIIKPLPGFMEGYTLEKPDYDSSPETVSRSGENAGYSIISSEYFIIPFRPGFAVLDDEAAGQLDIILTQLMSNPRKNMLISVYNESMSSSLYKNRINAVKSYMKIEGLSLDRIRLNYLEGKSSLDEFKVNFIE